MNAKIEDVLSDEAQLRVLERLDKWCDDQINSAQIEARSLEARMATVQKEIDDIGEKTAYHVKRIEALEMLKATNEDARKAQVQPTEFPLTGAT